ncbi:MAG: hypothetical protein ABI577_17795 [bacterium]
MRLRKRKYLLGLGIALIVAASSVPLIASAISKDTKEESGKAVEAKVAELGVSKLEGTWRVQVTIRNCDSAAELRPAFPALLTFGREGTLVETTTGIPPAGRTPGHGFWTRNNAAQTYTGVSEAFLFNPAGAWIGTQRLTQIIALDDAGGFASTASIEVIGPTGESMSKGCATAAGTLME